MVWRCREFFFSKVFVLIFSDQICFEIYLFGSFLYFKESIVAKNYNTFFRA